MKIVHVLSIDKGGAAKACIRLHLGLLKLGVDSKLLVLDRSDYTIPETYQYRDFSPSLKVRFHNKIVQILNVFKIYPTKNKYDYSRFLQNRPEGLEYFSFIKTPYDILTQDVVKNADIINLHWVAGFLDFESFFKHVKKPVVWTLHDMNPFTGGCHYAGNCKGYLIKCNDCPQLSGTIDPNIAEVFFNAKITLLKHFSNLFIATPSTWIKQESQNSKVLGKFNHYLIPNGLNTEIFRILPKACSRQILGLPLNKKILLFVSDSVLNKRKGISFLINALEYVNHIDDFIICTVGFGKIMLKNRIKIIELGKIQDEKLMAAAYSAADVFIIPSLEDNLPNTILEALCCGTPVIGFQVGGIKEMVKHGINGYLSNDITAKALGRSIELFFENPENFNNNEIRRNAILRYNNKVQAIEYVKLFNNSINS